jgi:integrase
MNCNRYTRVTAPAGFDGVTDRRDYYFKTKSAAGDFKARIKRWKAELKAPTETLSFDDNDKRWLAYLRAEIGALDQLPGIIGHWKLTAKAVTNPLTIQNVGAQYLAYRQKLKLSKACRIEDKYVIGQITAHLGSVPAYQVTPSQLRDFLAIGQSHSTKRKLYKVTSQMFDYARQERALVINPLAEIPRPRVTDVVTGILSIDTFEKLLRTADKEFPVLVPYIALAGFAGIRREELIREYESDQVLKWTDIDWNKKRITIRHEVAKRTKRKSGDLRFPPMEPALIDWLGPYVQAQGDIVPIVDSTLRKQYAKLCARIGHTPLKNELRHSYGTYWLAREKKEGKGQLAKRMGNSESTLDSNYLQILTPEDGRKWFGIRRKPEKKPKAAKTSTPAALDQPKVVPLPLAQSA